MEYRGGGWMTLTVADTDISRVAMNFLPGFMLLKRYQSYGAASNGTPKKITKDTFAVRLTLGESGLYPE